MKKSIVLSLLMLLCYSPRIFAQMGMGKPKEIKELAERKLIVITEEPSTKVIDKLKKKGQTAEIEKIQKMYDDFNALVKISVAQKWTMHQEVEYKTWTQFKKMDNKKREKYAAIYFLSKRAARTSSGYVPAKNLILNSDMDEETTTQHDFTSLFQTFTIDKAEDVPVDKIKFGNPVYSMTLPEVYPGALSVHFALQSTNIYFEQRLSGEKATMKSAKKEIAENSARLKEKTLLIREDWKDDDLTAGIIKEIYPYAFKFVSKEELEASILAGENDKAWLVVLPYVNSNSRSNSVIFVQQIIDNTDGQTLAMYMPSMGSMMLKGTIGGKSGKSYLTEKTLKEMVEKIDSKE
jgi:hypothetical protein